MKLKPLIAMKLSYAFRTLLLLVTALLSLTALGRAESTAFCKGTNALLSINLVSFDAATGDLQGRMNLKLPECDVNTETFAPKLS